MIKRLNLSGQELIQLGPPPHLFPVLQFPEMRMITETAQHLLHIKIIIYKRLPQPLIEGWQCFTLGDVYIHHGKHTDFSLSTTAGHHLTRRGRRGHPPSLGCTRDVKARQHEDTAYAPL